MQNHKKFYLFPDAYKTYLNGKYIFSNSVVLCNRIWKNLFKSCNHDPEHIYKHVKLIVISYSSIRLKYIAKVENQNLKTVQTNFVLKPVEFSFVINVFWWNRLLKYSLKCYIYFQKPYSQREKDLN